MMTLVFALVIGGMAFIFWRVIVGVRKNRAELDRAGARPERAPTETGTDRAVTPEEFRASGHELIDWIADYIATVEERPVQPSVEPGDVRAGLPEHPPAEPEPFSTVMADLDRVIVPGLTQWQHPNFFAYFPSNNSFPSILAELLTAGLGVQGMSWITSPACTELETLMLDWMIELLGLPGHVPVDERTRRRGHPGLGQRGRAGGDPRRAVAGDRPVRSTPTATPPGSSRTPRHRPTRASRRACASPASAPTGSAPCPTTRRSPCASTRSRR